LPWRPIKVSPIDVGPFFSGRGAAVMLSEIIYVWLPLAVLWICSWLLRKASNRRSRWIVADHTVRPNGD